MTGNPALISAGAGIIGAGVAAEGANKAAGQQVAAAEKAQADANTRYDATRAEQRGILDQSQANFAPYIGLGQGVLPTLGSMVGLQQQAAPAMNPTAATVPTAAPVAAPTGVDAMTMSPAQARAERQTASSYGKREGMTLGRLGGLVLVQSPDGSERRLLQRAKADQAIAAGATEVG